MAEARAAQLAAAKAEPMVAARVVPMAAARVAPKAMARVVLMVAAKEDFFQSRNFRLLLQKLHFAVFFPSICQKNTLFNNVPFALSLLIFSWGA